jgi:hypothetical protein
LHLRRESYASSYIGRLCDDTLRVLTAYPIGTKCLIQHHPNGHSFLIEIISKFYHKLQISSFYKSNGCVEILRP